MADTTPKVAEEGNAATPVPHDRVQMLSLRNDGTPAQTNPVFIGDPERALEATKEQFRQQAVSAVDVEERGVAAAPLGDAVAQDPSVEALQKKHDKAAKDAESAAEKVVKGLKV